MHAARTTIPPPQETPSPLRAARQRAGLTQVQLAAKAGTSIATVSLGERFGLLTTRSRQLFAKVLGIEPEALQ